MADIGTPISGTPPGVFVPHLIRNEALLKLQEAMVFGGLVNTSYQSDLSIGDRVSIGILDDVLTSNYTDYSSTVTHGKATATKHELIVNWYRGFDKAVSRKDIRQGTPGQSLVTQVARNGGFRLGNDIEKAVARLAGAPEDYMDDDDTVYAGVFNETPSGTQPSKSLGTYKTKVTGQDLWTAFGNIRTQLLKQRVPSNTPLWMVVSPEVEEALLNDKTLVLRDTPVGDDAFMNGFVGRMRGINIYSSLNVPATGTGATLAYQVMCGTRESIGLAIQLDSVDIYQLPNTGNRVWGISGSALFGAAVMKPDEVVKAEINLVATS